MYAMIIKRLFVLLIALLLASHLYGIEKDTAKRIANNFMSRGLAYGAGASTREPIYVWNGLNEDSAGEEPPFYVFEYPESGFVVVSACEVARPILAYSRTGIFDRNNEGLMEILSWAKEMIDEARKESLVPTESTSAEWSNYMNGRVFAEKEVVLETASWNQREPFNRMCPEIDGKRCPTGCVNTAAAIIMRYYKWPSAGKGHLPGYEYNGISILGRDLGHQYDWNNMPLDLGPYKYTEKQAAQVSQLMSDLGIMTETEYALRGSGAQSRTVLRLVQYFDYDAGMRLISRGSFNNSTWESIIKEQIDCKQPVYYAGYNHAFVINGYSGDYFSVNFGWGNASTFCLMTPIPNEEILIYFSASYQRAIIDIKPNENGEPYLDLTQAYSLYSDWDYSQDHEFMIKGANIQNYSTADFDGQIAYGLVGQSGIIKEIISDSFYYSIPSGESIAYFFDTPVRCLVHSELEEGDTIRFCYKETGSDIWKTALVYEATAFRITHNRIIESLISLKYDRSEKRILFDFLEGVSCRVYNHKGDLLFDGLNKYYSNELNIYRYNLTIFIFKGYPRNYIADLRVQFYDFNQEYNLQIAL